MASGHGFTEELVKSLKNPLKMRRFTGVEFYDPNPVNSFFEHSDTELGGYFVDRQAF